MHTGFLSEILKRGGSLGYLGTEDRIILKWVFGKLGVLLRTRLNCLGMGSAGTGLVTTVMKLKPMKGRKYLGYISKY
jgi:hypothetical protein